MADSRDRQGSGNEGRRKRQEPAGGGDPGDVPQEGSAAAEPEDAPAEPGEAPRRPPGLYGYDPDQWPEPN
jgi:hypothetical protein